jgi:hypothetical protein
VPAPYVRPVFQLDVAAASQARHSQFVS